MIRTLLLSIGVSLTLLFQFTSAAYAESKIKNVVYIISDDLKTSTLACYGDAVCKTPNIDRLAKEGVRFTRAYAQGTACAPSRPSLMFSRYTRDRIDTGVHQSFPELMKNNGWYSARVGKIFHMRVPGDIVAGTDGIDYPKSWNDRYNAQGMEESTPGLYECLNQNIFQTSMENRAGARTADRMFVNVRMDGDGSDQPDHKASAKAIEILREKKDEPFVLAVGFVRPHYPMVAPEKFFEPYPWEKIQMPETRPGDWDDIPRQGIPKSTSKSNGLDRYPDNQKRMWSGYYASVSFMDEQVGKILDELDRLGLRESTAIVFTSDHGYHLGDHDFWQKANLHEEVLNVPLIISAPGMKPGVSDSLVELVDIYPTVTDLVGMETPESCEGKSLVPIMKDPNATVRDYAFSYHGRSNIRTQYALRSDRWAYIQYADGVEELYDMTADPKQFTNRAKHDDYQTTIQEFRNALNTKLETIK